MHFLDKEVLDAFGVLRSYSWSVARTEFLAAVKLGYLFTRGSLLLPLSSFFESAMAREVIRASRALLTVGDWYLITSETDYDEFIEVKRAQYGANPALHPTYFQDDLVRELRSMLFPRRIRIRSSTQDISRDWRVSVAKEEAVWKSLYEKKASGTTPNQFQGELLHLPERLGTSAFIWSFVKDLLPVKATDSYESASLKRLISMAYVNSYLREFDAVILTHLGVGAFAFGIEPARQLSLEPIRRFLKMAGLTSAISSLTFAEAVEVRYSPEFMLFADRVSTWSRHPNPLDAARVLNFLSRERPRWVDKSARDTIRWTSGRVEAAFQRLDSSRLAEVGPSETPAADPLAVPHAHLLLLSQYGGPKNIPLREQQFRAWRDQFPSGFGQRVAETLLGRVDFFDRRRISEILARLLAAEMEETDPSRMGVALLGSPADSSAQISYLASDLMAEYGIFAGDLSSLARRPEIERVVFLDDNVGSGKQAAEVFRQWYGQSGDELDEYHVDELDSRTKEWLSERSVSVLVCVAFKEGVDRLRTTLEELGMNASRIRSFVNLDERVGCFDAASGVFSEGERIRARELVQRIGYQLLGDKEWPEDRKQRFALGYGGKEGLVVFYYNVPTSTLPLFWAQGTVDGQPWFPIFPRRPKLTVKRGG